MNCCVVGHRGARGLAPENTLEGMEMGLNLADAVECDIRLTKDCGLAVIHDNTLDRTTGRSGRVADYTLKEITSINVIDGGKIPSLEMLIKLVLDLNKKLMIEVKCEDDEPLPNISPPIKFLDHPQGIEPRFPAPNAVVLPLDEG